jgi:hypothetical protein
VDEEVAGAWARLRVTLRDLGLRMGVNDSWIAATAPLTAGHCLAKALNRPTGAWTHGGTQFGTGKVNTWTTGRTPTLV